LLASAQAELALGRWVTLTLRRPPVVGDSVALGHMTLVVRALDEAGGITRLGLGLTP
jgi:NhaP-type Na+/H+ and K+/H+ antiporter